MKAKHTPGPWESFQGSNKKDSEDVQIYIDNGNALDFIYNRIATVYDWKNAAIIRAAPDMLEALQNIENDDNSIPKPIWGMIQNAIKKAKP